VNIFVVDQMTIDVIQARPNMLSSLNINHNYCHKIDAMLAHTILKKVIKVI